MWHLLVMNDNSATVGKEKVGGVSALEILASHFKSVIDICHVKPVMRL